MSDRLLLLFVCWSLATVGHAHEPLPATCSLTIKLVDAETGVILAGIVRVCDVNGQDVPAIREMINRGQGIEESGPIHDWWVLPRPCAVTVPAAPLVFTALSGLETELAEKSVDLTGQARADLQISLVRFGNARRRGHRAGNTHLHLRKLSKVQADQYLREVPRVDGLDVVFVSYLERAKDDLEYTSNHYSPADLQGLSDRYVQFGYGEEHRHNFDSYGEGYGHVLLLDIPRIVQPVSIGPGITKQGPDAPPLQAGIDETRRLGGKVVWAHNHLGYEDIPNWVTGRIHANNVLDGNQHGSYEDPYYRYLNVGLRAPLSTGTDWFIYDFSRTYVMAAEATTPTQWLEYLAAGKSYVTNGPLLEFTVERSMPGSVLEVAKPRNIAINGQASGRTDFKMLELVQNGQVVRTAISRREGNHFVAAMELSLPIDKPCWLALRTPQRPASADSTTKSFARNEFGCLLFAHTSPIYVRLANGDVFDRKIAQGLIDELKSGLRKVEAQAVFENEIQRHRVFQVYEEAINTLANRLNSDKSATE